MFPMVTEPYGQMKKQSRKIKKQKNPKKKNNVSKTGKIVRSNEKIPQKKRAKQNYNLNISKKAVNKKKGEGNSISKFFSQAGQFLKESKIELKKVKWPTRKELLASTSVVIFLTLLVAFFLGVVDIGLIKIIKLIVR